MLHDTPEADAAIVDSGEQTGPTARSAPRPYLRGREIYLSPFSRTHAESTEYQRWLNDLDVVENLDLDDYRRPVPAQRLVAYYEDNALSPHSALFAIHENETNRFIGTVKVGPIKWVTRRTEMGIMIGESSVRGRGYGTEAIKLIVGYCFRILNLNRIGAGVHEENLASLRAFQHAGFREEGRFKQDQYYDGRLIDAIRIGIVRDDWDPSDD